MQAGGAATAQLVVVAVTPLLTRLYDEEDFGSFEVYAAIVTMVAVLSTGRLFEAIVVPSKDSDGRSVFDAGFRVLLGFVATALVLVALLRDVIAGWFDAPELTTLLWFAPIGILALGMRQLYQGWAVRSKDYRALAENNLSRGIAGSAINVGAGVAGLGGLGLALGHGGGFGFASWRLGRRLDVPPAAGAVSTPQVLKQYRRFPLLSGPSSLLNAASRGLPALALAALFGPVVVGYYALVTRALGQPLILFQEATTRVFSGEAAQLRRDGRAGMTRLAFNFVRSQALIGLVIVGAAFFLAPTLIPLVFGQRWAVAADYLQVLAPLFLVRTMAGPLMAIFSILGRQQTHLLVESVRFVAVGLAFLVSSRLELDTLATVGVFTAVAASGQIFAGAMAMYEMRRWDRNPVASDTAGPI
ncbi:MAG: oligosaccharide flippase family protein [Acidimicrobiales bacterium]